MAIATPTEYGGYEYTFVDPPPDRCICNICHHPSREPYMTGECCRGQTICKSCLDRWQLRNTRRPSRCPVCGKKGNCNPHPNYPIEREIKSLKVYCTNKKKGCKWQGELRDINNHLGNSDGCKFEKVKCSNKCGKMIERRYLNKHIKTGCLCRKVNCQYCHDTGEHQFIEGQHKEECPKLPLPCPNKCEAGIILREDMEAHRNECPLEMIHCEYYNVGCKRIKLARKDLEKHDNDMMKEHLMMTKNELTNIKSQLDVALRQITNLMVLVKAQLCPDTMDPDMRSVQLDAMVTTLTCVCPVAFKMTEYSDKKENDLLWCSDTFYSHNNGYRMCLEVDAVGYGDGEDTHLSVGLSLKKGPHDDKLRWPLRGEFEIALLNQISDSEHYGENIYYCGDDNSGNRITELNCDDNDGAWGFAQFISNDDLRKVTPTCQYLKNDCLFFKVTKL